VGWRSSARGGTSPDAGNRRPDSRSLAAFADRWAAAVAGGSYVGRTDAEVRSLLGDLTERLASILAGEPFSAGEAETIGAALVDAHFTDAVSLGQTIGVLDHLAATCPWLDRADAAARMVAISAGVATGFARATWLWTLAEQEQARRAVLDAIAVAHTALRASEARFRAVFHSAGVGIAVVARDGTVDATNPAMNEMIGRGAAELVGQPVDLLLDRDHRPLLDRVLRGEEEHVRFEQAYVRPDGRPAWIDLTISAIHTPEAPSIAVILAADVTQRHLLAGRLQHEATHDPLTRLPNRSLFFSWLNAAFAQNGRDDRVGVCYLDLDGFKAVNDTLGHDAGDELLAAVAVRLSTCMNRLGHRIARVGGDEFALVVTRSSGVDQLVEAANEILAVLRPPVQLAGHRITVTASIGIVERPVGGTTAAELMKAADLTLYWAKAEGKGRWALFDEARNADLLSRYALSAAMPAALERGEFVLDYQPLVRLGDSSMVGAEALIRWRHPKLGRLMPDRFVSYAEETGLIVPLGAWVLREACHQALRWQRDLQPVLVSVNLAAKQARAPGIVDEVRQTLAETGLAPELLQLELTETAAMGTTGEPLRALQRLAELGVRISIDDFGTGYSNLAYLRQLPVHGLKLAGSFVEGLRTERADPVDEQIVSSLVDMAHALGLSVTAEGVEEVIQVDRLRHLGCDLAQGYYFAAPMPAAELDDFLRPEFVA
jgi:diguanylate cyclase (GGDEF)-like protein/PAS domain S-box-containing protein